MIRFKRMFVVISSALMIAMAGACAKPYSLKVRYVPPEAPQQLQGQQLNVIVEDRRSELSVFSEKALSEFDRWNGGFSLVTTEDQAPGETYDLRGLVAAAMQERLTTMQVALVENGTDGVPTMTVSIEKFMIDLEGRTWQADFAYEVQLAKDANKIAREAVSGKAERTKVMGRGGGEKLIGELFTDGINKLNITKLFENAGLLE